MSMEIIMQDKELLKFIEDFKQGLTEFGTYGILSTSFLYSEKRKELLKCEYIELIPDFIKKCRTPEELWNFLKTKFNHYSERREFFREEFNPILEKLEINLYSKKSNVDEIKGKFNSDYIRQSIDLMDKLKESNPTEAIGKAKELIESCCKTILDEFGIKYNTTDDLSDLTKKTFKKLNISAQIPLNNHSIYKEENFNIQTFISKDEETDNEKSIITLVSFKNFDMLFTGDAGITAFNRLKKNIPHKIEILKVGHHGGSHVVDSKMLEHLNTEVSVISTGVNVYGHPDAGTLDTLRNTDIYRTDRHHAIKINTDGESYKIYIYRPDKHKFELSKEHKTI